MWSRRQEEQKNNAVKYNRAQQQKIPTMKKAAAIFKIILIGLLVLVAVIFIAFGYKDKTVKELTAKYAVPPSAFIEVDGMQVHYRDEGNRADSLPLVLIHGTGSSLHTFDAWAAGLKKEKRVVRMDIPAFGLTGPFPNRQYSIQHYVDDKCKQESYHYRTRE